MSFLQSGLQKNASHYQLGFMADNITRMALPMPLGMRCGTILLRKDASPGGKMRQK